MVLVGDFDQKLPVGSNGSLTQVLVNNVTYLKRRLHTKGTQQQRTARAFSQFKKYELKTNHRLKGKQPELKELLSQMRDNSILRPITHDFLKKLPQLRMHDDMTPAQQHE